MIYKIKINPDLLLKIKDRQPNQMFNESLFAYRDDLLTQGIQPYRNGQWLCADIDTSRASFDIQDFLTVKSTGGRVEFYNPLIKVPVLNIDDEIPVGLSNRVYQVQIDTVTEIDKETGEEIQSPVYDDRIHTWKTWRDNAHPLGEPVDGYYYFMSATFGKVLTDDELMLIHNTPDIELVDNVPQITEIL